MIFRVGAATGDTHHDPRPILIVTGLAQEARIAEGPGLTVICSSSDPTQLRAMLRSFDGSSVRGVISFGVAGGLDPKLRSGDVIVATSILASAEASWSVETHLNPAILNGFDFGRRRVMRGALVGVEQVVVGRAAKADLHARTGAVAVDMESHIAAAFATEQNLPFAALRVVSDPASRSLPALAVDALKPDGNVDLRKVIRGVARQPTVIKELVSTGRDFNRALRGLRGCRELLAVDAAGATATSAKPSLPLPTLPPLAAGRT